MRLHCQMLAALALLIAVLLGSGCQREQNTAAQAVEGGRKADATKPLSIGHTGSPLLGPLYAAHAQSHPDAAAAAWELTRFDTGGDIGYALLAGKIAAGFVETEKVRKLLVAPGGDQLLVAGAIRFPYGATLVLRQDLQLRLTELAGKHLAALEPDCVINHQFNQDARRHGLDTDQLRYSYMPFADMLPALEARAIDGALIKGAYGVLAELAGHKILYQNWEIAAGDDCCPASLAQTEFFLVVRKAQLDRLTPFIRELLAADGLPPAELRAAVGSRLGYPAAALERFPVASFALLDDEARKIIGEQQCAIVR